MLERRVPVMELKRVPDGILEHGDVADAGVERITVELDAGARASRAAATSSTPNAIEPPNIDRPSVRLPVSYSTQRSPGVRVAREPERLAVKRRPPSRSSTGTRQKSTRRHRSRRCPVGVRRVASMEGQQVAVRIEERGHVADAGVERLAVNSTPLASSSARAASTSSTRSNAMLFFCGSNSPRTARGTRSQSRSRRSRTRSTSARRAGGRASRRRTAGTACRPATARRTVSTSIFIYGVVPSGYGRSGDAGGCGCRQDRSLPRLCRRPSPTSR